ncbi:hypothetical protein D3C76_1542810 [compost metagenome]
MTLIPSLAALDFSWSARLAVSVTPMKLTVLLPTVRSKLAGAAAAPLATAIFTSVLAAAVRPPIAPLSLAAMSLAEAPAS